MKLLLVLLVVTSRLPTAMLDAADDACDELTNILDDTPSYGRMEPIPVGAVGYSPDEYSKDVLNQFHCTVPVSVGQRRLLTFMGSPSSDFLYEGLDTTASYDLMSRIGQRLDGYSSNNQSVTCSHYYRKYRTADGSCNNMKYPKWGMSAQPLRRLLPAVYSDGKKAPRKSVVGNQDLPGTRDISVGVTAESELVTLEYTALNHHFGQLLSHEQNHVAVQAGGCNNCTESDICLPIPISPDDPVYGPLGRKCLEFTRSVGGPSNCGDQPLAYDQPNRITSYTDASFLYGSNQEATDKIRIPGDPQGLLRYTPNPVEGGKEFLPPDTSIKNCAGRSENVSCGLAGDARASEQVGLTALHLLWVREHNRLAKELHVLNSHWDGETVYQETRRLVIAKWQHIVYNEHIPILLGPYLSRQYGIDVEPLLPKENPEKAYRYNENINPSITNVYATAAFRHGHSQIPTNIWRADGAYQRLENIPMKRAFFNATHIFNTALGGPDSVLRGMLIQPLNDVDTSFTPAVTRQLFEDPNEPGFGMDLIAINIQRGRDHGLAPYVHYREICNLEPITEWRDLHAVMSRQITERLQKLYRTFEDIDAYVGLFSERHALGSLVGPTLACLIGTQFNYLKFGDRFWYDNIEGDQKFTNVQREEIRAARLARILCDNVDGLVEVQPYAFVMPDMDCTAGNDCSIRNRMTNCNDTSSIPRFNLQAWIEPYKD